MSDLQALGLRIAFAVGLVWAAGAALLWRAINAGRKVYPARITSWYRPSSDLPGGAGAKSKHTIGWAVDLVPLDPDHYGPLVAFLNKFPGVYAIDHVGTARHIHAQVGLTPLRNNPKKGA